jgi:hypothetical protein
MSPRKPCRNYQEEQICVKQKTPIMGLVTSLGESLARFRKLGTENNPIDITQYAFSNWIYHLPPRGFSVTLVYHRPIGFSSLQCTIDKDNDDFLVWYCNELMLGKLWANGDK